MPVWVLNVQITDPFIAKAELGANNYAGYGVRLAPQWYDWLLNIYD